MSITKEQLKNTLRNIMKEESDYQTFFKAALEKAGKSIPSMSDEEKKAFFDKIDAAWDAKGEKNEALTDKQKQLDIDGDGEIEASDLAALRAGEKANEAHDCGCGCGGTTEGGCNTSVTEGFYKSIMSNGGRNLFFAMVNDKTDDVKTIDAKTWLKSSMMDNASDVSKDRVIKAILKNEKQFNKNVEYNMWAKKNNPSFEEKMDYFFKNNFISNITNKGIKVYESVNEGISPKDMDTIKSAVTSASSFMNIGAALKKTGLRYIFATSPMPIYIVQDKSGNRVGIVNKKYADKPDFVHGDTAVGIMESKSLKEFDADTYRKKQDFVIGRKFAQVASDSDVELMARLKKSNNDHKWNYDQNIKSMDNLYKKYKIRSKKGIEESVVNEVGTNDWHFKAIKQLWDKAGDFTKKKVAALITKNPKATWDKIEKALRSSDYDDVTYYTDMLQIESINEGRAFINAAKKAKAEGKTEFEFNGKTYPVTIKENLSEARLGKVALLKQVEKGNTSQVEGVKISPDLAFELRMFLERPIMARSRTGIAIDNSQMKDSLKMMVDAGIEKRLSGGVKTEFKKLIEKYK